MTRRPAGVESKVENRSPFGGALSQRFDVRTFWGETESVMGMRDGGEVEPAAEFTSASAVDYGPRRRTPSAKYPSPPGYNIDCAVDDAPHADTVARNYHDAGSRHGEPPSRSPFVNSDSQVSAVTAPPGPWVAVSRIGDDGGNGGTAHLGEGSSGVPSRSVARRRRSSEQDEQGLPSTIILRDPR